MNIDDNYIVLGNGPEDIMKLSDIRELNAIPMREAVLEIQAKEEARERLARVEDDGLKA